MDSDRTVNSVGVAGLVSALERIAEPVLILRVTEDCAAIVFVNRALVELLKLPSTNGLVLDRVWPAFEACRDDRGEFATEFRDGEGNPVTVKLAVDADASGVVIVRVLAGQAQNDSIRTFHVQRLETLGMLSGGIAHDFNNILAGILGHVTYLKTILPQTGPHVESIGAVEDGARKAAGMTQQILNFSRLESGQAPGPVNLNDLVVKTCSLVRRAVPPDIAVDPLLPEATTVAVLAVESQLAQVIVNLVINARDAFEGDGSDLKMKQAAPRIQIGLSRISDRAELARVFGGADLSAPSYALVAVTDNGQGMSPDIRARIFEPYFTTKKERGTGLGLATVATIVQRFGGTVRVDSELGRGTTIAIYFPEVSLPVGQNLTVANTQARTPLARGKERVLIVDDEYPVRNVLSISLQHLGYHVVTAQSGAEALALYEGAASSPTTKFELVILDMLMPQMSGETLFFKLQAFDPAVRVLVMSGYTSAESINNVLEHGGLDFLMKPFTIEELSRKVRECF